MDAGPSYRERLLEMVKDQNQGAHPRSHQWAQQDQRQRRRQPDHDRKNRVAELDLQCTRIKKRIVLLRSEPGSNHDVMRRACPAADLPSERDEGCQLRPRLFHTQALKGGPMRDEGMRTGVAGPGRVLPVERNVDVAPHAPRHCERHGSRDQVERSQVVRAHVSHRSLLNFRGHRYAWRCDPDEVGVAVTLVYLQRGQAQEPATNPADVEHEHDRQ